MITTKELEEFIECAGDIFINNDLDKEYRAEIGARLRERDELLKNQPTITSADVQGWADELRERVCTHKSWMYVGNIMREMLKEAGVSITVDPDIKSGKE